ncbi:MAG: transglutaminase family protein, partial [Pseudomonadota bacterium]
MDLTLNHKTTYVYEPGPSAAALRLKLFPANSGSQAVSNWAVTVNGEAITPLCTEASGDPVALWHKHGALDEVEVIASGRIQTSDKAGVISGLQSSVPIGVYLRRTDLTNPDQAIRKLAGAVTGDTPLEKLHALSSAISDAIEYRPGATNTRTTAIEALAIGAGICQDQTHVFLSAARVLSIPARYVVGYLFDQEADGPQDTHAWAEAHIAGLGWTGFDVTHQLCPTDAYVRVCCGLDADDAAPIRGNVVGEVSEALTT